MTSCETFAYYRLPYADTYSVVAADGLPVILSDYGQVGREPGFVIAPFANREDTPIVLIPAARVESKPVPAADEAKVVTDINEGTQPSDAYARTFEAFHSAICDGRFAKLVLSRNKCLTERNVDAKALFLDACRRYPRLMIMLWHTPQTGTWLVASPEILCTMKGDGLQTMALAGTMAYREGYVEWSEKNKHEQHIVEEYVENAITPLSRQVLKDGPVTSRAGELIHLRTDFHFRLAEGKSLGDVVERLHPTPAVCGIPTDEARRFIINNEHQDRRYYSGFAGPVGIRGEAHLYVSLRCAELTDGVVAYSGGGIMPESTCVSEWQETEAKMETIGFLVKAR